MLGLGRDNNGWRWAVCGKHPSGRDYFSFDIADPLQSALTEWMDRGFAALPDNPDIRRAIRFWRFWAKGVQKGQLVCGLLQGSSDGIGRAYPLLIVGTGGCSGWEKHWECLPRELEALWQHLEFIASRRFEQLAELAVAIRSIRSPAFYESSGGPGESDSGVFMPDKTAGDESLLPDADCFKGQKELLISLDDHPALEPASLSVLWGLQCKKHGLNIPRAFFVGGSPGKRFLAVFARSLQPRDFVRLWSAGEKF